MEVILDELSPLEFFNHGGIVKVTVGDDLVKECNVKKKQTFFEYRPYVRFLGGLYISHHKNQKPSALTYEYVNSRLDIKAYIGSSEYVLDLNYDQMESYECANFYYYNERTHKEIEKKDPYGIRNVNFSLIDEDDGRWEDYKQQRLERGFDDSELWSLDGTIARFIYPRLKAFAESEYDRMDGLDLSNEDESYKEALKTMVTGFELLASDASKSQEELDMEQEALDLFAKNFNALWN